MVRSILSSAVLAVFSFSVCVAAEPGEKILRLEQLDLTHMTQGWGEAKAGKTIIEKPLRIHGRQFEHGVGTHAISQFAIDLKGAATAFHAWVGLDDETEGEPGSVNFLVFIDKRKVFESGVMKFGQGPKEVRVDLTRARRLDLIVEDGDDSTDYDHADWADAYLTLDPKSNNIPESLPRKIRATGILTPPPSPAPRINAAGVIGAGAWRDFLYFVPVAGQRPMKIRVEGLPEGLTFDRGKGIVRGLTGKAGEYALTIEAENRYGRDRKSVRLSIGSGLALTPPMGWNSWNCWGTSVDEDKVKAAAEAMVETGLIHHGWAYINIDDAWHGRRDPRTGEISSNEKFPSMERLARFIHSKGLKFGLYTDVGPKTCASFEGSMDHDFRDAQTYAKWGVDYVKVDWCNMKGKDSEPAYRLFGRALAESGRDIVYSICNWGFQNPWEWGEDVGGNLWRTTGDIVDTWGSVYDIANKQAPLYPYAKPGHWNDPDMLVVGKVGWGPQLRNSRLTPDQQYSHISLWCLFSAPLILGCDLTQLDDFTLNLLTNDEVLAINQDMLGSQARRVVKEGAIEVWAKDLADGAKAVGIFVVKPDYFDELALKEFSLSWKAVGLSGPQSVRDLWRQKDLGVFSDAFTVSLPDYGVCLVRVAPAK
jgi:alpha-galactosidase